MGRLSGLATNTAIETASALVYGEISRGEKLAVLGDRR
jgi:hypothetical protein